jgi:hypothetical protein
MLTPLALGLVQVFCIICPVITPVACFYFAMQYLVWCVLCGSCLRACAWCASI